MEAQAGLGAGVIGDFSAPVGIDCGVLLAGGHDLDAPRPEQRAQPDAEGEIEVLLEFSVGEAAAGIVAAVRCVENHEESGRLGGGNARRLGGAEGGG